MRNFLVSLVLGTSLLSPSFVQAQGLVSSCEGASCSACDIITLANNVIQWVISIAFIFFAILAVYHGFKLVTSGGNSGAKSAAKSGFTNAFIGLFIMLGGFLVVDTIMRGVVRGADGQIEGYGPWAEIKCALQTAPRISSITIEEGDFEVRPPSANDNVVPAGLSDTPTGASGMNVRAAVTYLIQHARAQPQGLCLRYVSEAINAGLPGFPTRGVAHAKDVGPKLLSHGFTRVYSGTYSSPATDRAFRAQAGDVAVFQPGCTSSASGHAAMYTGTMWVSDFRQNQMGPNSRGTCPVTIYRP